MKLRRPLRSAIRVDRTGVPRSHQGKDPRMRQRTNTSFIAAAVTILPLLFAIPATRAQKDKPAQQPQSDAQHHGGSERIDVDLVNVDVYVSDKKGNPLVALSPDDFQVFEDEKKVKVTNFLAGGEL